MKIVILTTSDKGQGMAILVAILVGYIGHIGHKKYLSLDKKPVID